MSTIKIEYLWYILFKLVFKYITQLEARDTAVERLHLECVEKNF